MAHENRGRFTVDLDGNWRLYTQTLPAGAKALGTVTRGDGDSGALVQLTSGAYVQFNAGAIRNLDGRRVAAAIGTAGRPPELDGGRRVNVYLDAASIATASRLGQGNVSDGIRIALAKAAG